MRILVTGATGRLGRLVIPLLKHRYQLRLLVRDRAAARSLWPEIRDVAHVDLIKASDDDLLSACKDINYAIHTAALVDYAASETALMLANWLSTARLVRALKQKGAKGIVYISSTSVYGRRPQYLPIDERHPLKPSSAYGRSKLLAEEEVRRSNLSYIILRPCLIYGPGYEEGFRQVAEAIKQQRASIIGDGNNRIALVHASDVARAIVLALKALTKDRIKRGEFNIASEALTQRDCFATVARFYRVPAPEKHVAKWLAYFLASIHVFLSLLRGKRPNIFPEYVATLAEDRCFSSEKAMRELGWRPRKRFESEVAALLSKLKL